MFNSARRILLTLLHEGLDLTAQNMHPLERGAAMFRYLVQELPVDALCRNRFPGVFGLENLDEEGVNRWQKRFDALLGKHFSFGVNPPGFAPFDAVGCKISNGGRGHLTPDYGFILQHGLKAVYQKVQSDSIFDKAAADALLAVKDFAQKFGRRVPWEPARNFDEALESIWLTYECLIFSEHDPYSYSWGRMDQYLLPFANGMTQADMTEKLVQFFQFLAQFNVKDDATALNIGGLEGMNIVSRAIVDAMAQTRLPGPLLTARIAENTPDDDVEYLLKTELLTCGQPTLYGEEACRKALVERGVERADLDNWVVNSCMGLYIPGKEWQDMWGAVILMPLALEMALNMGVPLKASCPLPSDVAPMSLQQYDDFERVYCQTIAYVRCLFASMVKYQREKRLLNIRHIQNPLVSAVFDNCIARQKEVRDGGAHYMNMVVETMGIANLSDALVTVKELVFKTGRYSLAHIRDAMKTDFSDAADLLEDIKALPKYGQNDDETNAMMRRLTDDVAAIAASFAGDGFTCSPSLHTLHQHVTYGVSMGATADGRPAGAPFAKNAGTSPQVMAPHTSLVLSATYWNQSRFHGGQALDLWINPDDWQSQECRRRYIALFRTYFRRGGLQLQVNGANPEELRAAMVEPEKHQDLIVRIGGFSMRFVAIPRQQQEDFVRRFAVGM